MTEQIESSEASTGSVGDTMRPRHDEEAAVLAAADALIAAFGHHDVERYFAAFRPDASFVFHTHPERLDSVADYRDLWRSWERDFGFRVIDCQSSNRRVDVYGECAVFTHDVVTTVENTDGPRAPIQTTTSERETIVFARSGGGWLAVHEHLSGR
ncbi:nuclear transport factor 2 family protein [Mycolicibacterium brisbanense]